MPPTLAWRSDLPPIPRRSSPSVDAWPGPSRQGSGMKKEEGKMPLSRLRTQDFPPRQGENRKLFTMYSICMPACMTGAVSALEYRITIDYDQTIMARVRER
ncbi:hypothetical protein P170DRAFT_437913 [Aspergillus steynii IBT 23096]|uniref:Uncharacterized protein n=1 Tax=Aspergillus steynii IBT 23096 TaxID=1392250 RepID=A0A2I2G5W9_9EURO|nr:uncharacterized protein P170DRAFT_437913 [Aspergillus steynii IBT 23096]PLB48243.1 hypothetical protein P170DRAFT_437913 [Aspergillus steynii IBT 23096]